MIDTTTGMQIKYLSGQHRHAGTSRDGILQPVTLNFKTATPRDPWCFTRHSADRKTCKVVKALFSFGICRSRKKLQLNQF